MSRTFFLGSDFSSYGVKTLLSPGIVSLNIKPPTITTKRSKRKHEFSILIVIIGMKIYIFQT